MDLRVVFMGSPDFALPTLSGLDQISHVVGVVTQPDRPAGRGRSLRPPEVKMLAQSLGLPLIQPVSLKAPDVIQQLIDWLPDVIVVAAFGQILRENVLNLPKYGCINVHASLLPRWRGAAPIQMAILNDDITGVTIMKMDRGLDTGPVLNQNNIPILDDMNTGTLSEVLAHMGAELLVETLPLFLNGSLQPQPQDDAAATFAPRLKKRDGLLNFNQPASCLTRMVRAYDPWPGAYEYFDEKRLKVFKAHSGEALDCIPGERYIIEEKPAWGTGKGCLILDEVQVAGKRRVSGEDFINGTPNWISRQEKI